MTSGSLPVAPSTASPSVLSVGRPNTDLPSHLDPSQPQTVIPLASSVSSCTLVNGEASNNMAVQLDPVQFRTFFQECFISAVKGDENKTVIGNIVAKELGTINVAVQELTHRVHNLEQFYDTMRNKVNEIGVDC